MYIKFVILILLVGLIQSQLTSALSSASGLAGGGDKKEGEEGIEILEEDEKKKGPPPINLGKEEELDKEEGAEYYFEGEGAKNKFIDDRMLEIKDMENQINRLKMSVKNKLDNLKTLVDDSLFRSRSFKVKVDAKTKRLRPIRVHCGHWYHLGCLDKAMNEPPFGIEQTCTGIGDIACERPLYHPNWSFEDAHERERIYNQRQAREREIADAADFF